MCGAMTHPDGMEVDLRYLSEEKSRHGKRVLYARRNGKRIRLKHPASSPEFLDEYRQAVRALFSTEPATRKTEPEQSIPFAPKTFGWLVERYLSESPLYKTMKPTGQKRRRTILEGIKEKHGRKPMIIPADRIAAGLANRAEKPGAANNWLKTIKALYSWAESVGIIDANPAKKIGKIETDTEGYYTWSLDDIRAYFKRHPIGSMSYLAAMTLLFTGLRRSDATKIGRQHVRSGVIRFKTGKTGAMLIVDVPWPLQDAIDARPETGQLALLLSGWGSPFASGASFGNWFKDRCVEASLPDCSPHGLRKGGATIMSENGGSEVELDAMYGWANNRQSGTYTRNARNRLLATKGFERIIETLVADGILKPRTAEQNEAASVAP